ncbi:MAG: D-2-hydroxyacid dehydrogenase [Bacteroidaceae bacterium]|nr:D-2-hydroxyacid dehydrogenase [Bacteroidaceae bacterium]
MKVVILDGFSVTQQDLSWQALEALDVQLTVYDRTRAEDTIARCREAEAVLTNKVLMTAEVIDALPHLRYIGVLATGYNVVEGEAARRRDITVTNIPAYSTASVAQLVFAHLLNITNSVAHYAAENAATTNPATVLATTPVASATGSPSRWPQSPDFLWMDTPLTELAGKTFAIYGLGNIGTAVARIAQAFGMRVIAVTSKKPETLPAGIEKVTWEEALQQADVLSLHCPLTPETCEMINAHTLKQMKPTAILINTGRGPLVNEAAVAAALHAGHLAAYCADVLSTEPPSADNPLLTAPRCYLTPHIAWATREARERLIATATGNLKAFMAGQPVNVIHNA